MPDTAAQYIGLKVTVEELQKLELIMRVERRSTRSDTLRALILEKADFLMSKNRSAELKQEQQKEQQP